MFRVLYKSLLNLFFNIFLGYMQTNYKCLGDQGYLFSETTVDFSSPQNNYSLPGGENSPINFNDYIKTDYCIYKLNISLT